MGAYSTDSHANFVYLPPWREVFDGTGLQVRNYAVAACESRSAAGSPPARCWAAVAPIALH